MKFLNYLQSIFPVTNNLGVTEKFSSYEISYETNLNEVSVNNLTNLFSKFPKDDFIKLTTLTFIDPITITTSDPNFEEFVDKIKEEKASLEDEKVVFKLIVSKNQDGSVLTIYDFDAFCTFWHSLSLETILEYLTKPLKTHKKIYFQPVFDSIETFYTENIIFSSEQDLKIQQHSTIEISKIRSNCHFENFEKFPFTSQYFRLIKRPLNENAVTKVLDKLSFIFCVTGIFDITAINGSNLYSKINGYKSIELNNDINTIDISSILEYQNIYDWIHSEKSHVTDKIGLARNILSLYLKDGNYSINENVFTSIKSGFKTYLQQNINRYIDIRNKIGDQVTNISQKTNDLAEKYLGNYQKSNFAFISFFISIFLLKVLSTSKFENIFTKDTTILFFAFIGISIIYFLFTLITFNQEKKRIHDKYYKLKSRHEDLLDKADIDNILRNDEEFKEDMAFLVRRRNSYSYLWILTILIFVSAVLSLSTYINWTIFRCSR